MFVERKDVTGGWEVTDGSRRGVGTFTFLSFDTIETQMRERGALKPGEKIGAIDVRSYGLNIRIDKE